MMGARIVVSYNLVTHVVERWIQVLLLIALVIAMLGKSVRDPANEMGGSPTMQCDSCISLGQSAKFGIYTHRCHVLHY